MPSNHLILWHPLLFLPSIFPSIRVFSKESILRIRWPKYWSFSLPSVLPKNIQDWSPLGWTGWIALQSKGLSGVLSAPQLKSISSSALSFLYNKVQLSHPYMTTGKTKALTRRTFLCINIRYLFFSFWLTCKKHHFLILINNSFTLNKTVFYSLKPEALTFLLQGLGCLRSKS